MRNELVELSFPNQCFQVEQEIEPLFVRNTGKRIIRVLSFQVSDQFGELMIVAKMFHRVFKRFPAYDS